MPKRVMIVDDEPGICETLTVRLQANGYQVSSSMGAKSIPDIRTFRPDIILLDIMMPEMDGYAVIKELKRDHDLCNTPVIILSAKPKDAIIELFAPEGIVGYISKPFDSKNLLAMIKKALGE